MERENKLKLFTGEIIDIESFITLKEIVPISTLNVEITFNCAEVTKDNFIKALKSITHNGIRDSEIQDIEDYYQLIVDYVNVKSMNNGKYLMLTFDEIEEQDISLLYKLTELETKRYLKDNNYLNILI